MNQNTRIAPLSTDPHCTHDHQALEDMVGHARTQLHEFQARPDSFHGTSDWSHEWMLHWIDVEHHGSQVRIYHAAHKHHHHRRFTMISDSHGAQPGVWKAQ